MILIRQKNQSPYVNEKMPKHPEDINKNRGRLTSGGDKKKDYIGNASEKKSNSSEPEIKENMI